MKKKADRINGICADAQRLGVSREHLRLCLQGKRQSNPLIQRYAALKEQQNAEAAK